MSTFSSTRSITLSLQVTNLGFWDKSFVSTEKEIRLVSLYVNSLTALLSFSIHKCLQRGERFFRVFVWRWSIIRFCTYHLLNSVYRLLWDNAAPINSKTENGWPCLLRQIYLYIRLWPEAQPVIRKWDIVPCPDLRFLPSHMPTRLTTYMVHKFT